MLRSYSRRTRLGLLGVSRSYSWSRICAEPRSIRGYTYVPEPPVPRAHPFVPSRTLRLLCVFRQSTGPPCQPGLSLALHARRGGRPDIRAGEGSGVKNCKMPAMRATKLWMHINVEDLHELRPRHTLQGTEPTMVAQESHERLSWSRRTKHDRGSRRYVNGKAGNLYCEVRRSAACLLWTRSQHNAPTDCAADSLLLLLSDRTRNSGLCGQRPSARLSAASILNFSYNMAFNNVEEAYRALCSTTSSSRPLCLEMAKMSVKTRRLGIALKCIEKLRMPKLQASLRYVPTGPKSQAATL